MNIIVKEITLLDIVIKERDEKLTRVSFCDTKTANKKTLLYFEAIYRVRKLP